MDTNITKIIREGGVGVLPTDTIYGLVAGALNKKAVEKVYRLKKRVPSKPSIILISSIEDLKRFKITVNELTANFLQHIWPNPVSIILPCPRKEFEYLHRGTNSLAFRIPKYPELLKLLNETGPIIAPSANFEGDPPAETIEEARRYFGENANFYIDGGILKSSPSTLIKIKDDQVTTLREGAFEVTEKSIR